MRITKENTQYPNEICKNHAFFFREKKKKKFVFFFEYNNMSVERDSYNIITLSVYYIYCGVSPKEISRPFVRQLGRPIQDHLLCGRVGGILYIILLLIQ